MILIIAYYIFAFIIGFIVGLSELLSRYPWPVLSIFKSVDGWIYLLLNSIAAVLAYQVAVDWQLIPDISDKGELWRVFFASLFGMGILRSFFF